MDQSERMDHSPRSTAGDPPAFACGGRNPSIRRDRQLQCDPGPPFGNPCKITALKVGSFGGAAAGVGLDPGLRQRRDPAPGDARIGILVRRNNSGDTRLNQRVCAGRRLAGVRTGLKRDIGGGTPGRLASHRQRPGFRVGSAAIGGPTAPDDAPVAHDDTAHRRIGPDAPQPPRRKI